MSARLYLAAHCAGIALLTLTTLHFADRIAFGLAMQAQGLASEHVQ